MKILVKCLMCGIERRYKPSDVANGRRYCSLKCAYKARELKPNPEIKTCISCRQELPASSFRPHHKGSKRLASTCNGCNANKIINWAESLDPEEKLRKTREASRQWKERNPQYWETSGYKNKRRVHLKSLYGLTPEEYESMFREQHGRCAICFKTPSGKGRSGRTLHVDHNHKTGEIRGLLCSQCNLALGLFADDPLIIRRVYAYLKKNPSTTQDIRSEDEFGLFDQGINDRSRIQ